MQGNQDNDDMLYHLEIVYEVSVAKWRLDNPDMYNPSLSLSIYDKNMSAWVYLTDCTRPGERAQIVRITKLDEAPGRSPEDSTNDVNS